MTREAWTFVAIVCAILFCWIVSKIILFAKGNPPMPKGYEHLVPPSAGLRPEEGERPFPGPVVVHLSVFDRLEKKQTASPAEELDFRIACKVAARKVWERRVSEEIAEIIADAEAGKK